MLRLNTAENVFQKQALSSVLHLITYEVLVGLVSNATVAVFTAVATLATALKVTVAFLRHRFSCLLIGRLVVLGVRVVLIRLFLSHCKIGDVITKTFIVLWNHNAFTSEEIIEPLRVSDKVKIIGLSKQLII